MKEKCPNCGGEGFFIYPAHHPSCTGDNCSTLCPVAEREACQVCEGTGWVPDKPGGE